MLLSWSDYYSGSYTLYSQKTTRLASFSGNAYISNCFFNGLSSTSSGGGGSIYCASSDLLMLVESTTFINSQSSGLGGAIHFSSGGQFVMAKVCAYGCKTTSSNCLCYRIVISGDTSYKNEVHDSAICFSIQPSYGYETQHSWGKVVIKQTNFSSNSCSYYSSIFIQHSSNSVASSISYTSVANNVDSSGYCIHLDSSYLHEVDSCNFISNTDKSSSSGLMKVYGPLNLRGSCIVNNSGAYIIYNSGGKSITVINCTIDSTNKFYGSVIIESTPKTSFINKIECIETAHCYAHYDSVGSLTVIPNVSKSYPFGVPPDKVEIIIQMYCNKHTDNDIIRAFNYLIMQLFISSEL